MSPPHSCFCAYNRTMDLRTPRNVKLTAFFRRSFAFRTVRDRLPVLLTKIIDNLSQTKDDIAKDYGIEAKDDIKNVVGKISRLKYEIQTNKPLKNFKSKAPDALIYNECILERDGQEGPPTPFHTVWLLVECYMYRKIWEAFERTKYLTEFDPFRNGKEELFHSALPQMKETLGHLQKLLENGGEGNKDDFCTLLEIDLWSNKCDLSFNVEVGTAVFVSQVSELSKNILANDCEKVWEALQSTESDSIDIVLDNAGKELFLDLCLAHYLSAKKMCKKIYFHVKNIPWFMSDVMAKDIKWMLDQMNEREGQLKDFAKAWINYFDAGTWEIKNSDFWTLPVDFEAMHKYDRELYQHLSKSKMIFFKGDLNYRKLFRECFWNPETPVSEAQGLFAPSRLVAIRTCKAEIICGLPKNLAEVYDEKDPLWLENGEYGVIQFSDKIVPLISENDLIKLSSTNLNYWDQQNIKS